MNNRIPQEVLEQILKHHDIVETVNKHVQLSKRGKNYIGLCPFHSERTPSFTVSPDKQFYHCFGCGASGNSIKFVMEMESLSFVEAVQYLGEEANVQYDWSDTGNEEASPENTAKQILLSAHEWTAKWYHYILNNTEQGKIAMEYLISRGFSNKSIEQFQIGYAPLKWDSLATFLEKKAFDLALMERGGLLLKRSDGTGYIDRFRDRIMFPIKDARGQIIAFSGRVIQEGQPKYLNSPETLLFDKSKILYNIDIAKTSARKSGKFILFEGFLDVIKASDAGFDNGIAAMGTAFSSYHAQMMKRFASDVIVCYDGDEAGRRATSNSIEVLNQARMKSHIIMLPKNMDPDDYLTKHGTGAFRNLIEQPISPMKFKLESLKSSFSMHSESGQLQYNQQALRLIAALESPTEREHYLNHLAAESSFSADTLKQELNEIRQNFQKTEQRRDKNEISWHNVMNDGITSDRTVVLRPAYYTAERKLLEAMMKSQDICHYVEEHLGSAFNVEIHAALAAYLYAYYAKYADFNNQVYISMLEDDRLESAATSIMFMENEQMIQMEVIDDYIKEIKKLPIQKEIDRKKIEMQQAERSGNIIEAAQIASEIITLERNMKPLQKG